MGSWLANISNFFGWRTVSPRLGDDDMTVNRNGLTSDQNWMTQNAGIKIGNDLPDLMVKPNDQSERLADKSSSSIKQNRLTKLTIPDRDDEESWRHDDPVIASTPYVNSRLRFTPDIKTEELNPMIGQGSQVDLTLTDRSHRKQKEPMRYNGKGDWDDYLSHFNAVARWNGWSEVECGMQLAISLVDDAREVLSSLPLECRGDYVPLVRALEQRFSPSGRESRYSLELMKRTCMGDEDVTAYGHALRRLATKAYPGRCIDEQVLIDLYIRGLPSTVMKRYVHSQRPQTLSGAINFAVTYESFEDSPVDQDTRKARKPQTQVDIRPVSAVNQTSTGTGSTDNLSQKLDRTVKVLDDVERRLRKMETQGRTSYPTDGRAQSMSGSHRPSGRPNIECFNCRGRGHIARDCPKRDDYVKQASDQSRQNQIKPLN